MRQHRLIHQLRRDGQTGDRIRRYVLPTDPGLDHTISRNPARRVRRALQFVIGAALAGALSAGTAGAVPTRVAAAPVNKTVPVIVGYAYTGSTVTAHPGTWRSGAGAGRLSYQVQWLRCAGNASGCRTIVGAHSYRYPIPAADIGKTLRVRVTASKGGSRTTATSKATPKITLPVTRIAVAAGKPSELAFTLSRISRLPAGTVVFNVTNAGKIVHDFVICLVPTTKAPNACVGSSKQTAFLQPGKSAVLTVKLLKSGTYEYLCSFPGHAAAGMKGLLGIKVPVTASLVAKAIKAAATTTTTTTTTAGTTTTTTTGSTTTVANDGCPAGVTIVTSGNTDNDSDETGQPSDGDGCI